MTEKALGVRSQPRLTTGGALRAVAFGRSSPQPSPEVAFQIQIQLVVVSSHLSKNDNIQLTHRKVAALGLRRHGWKLNASLLFFLRFA